MAQLQQTKLANHRLEDEKAELLNELRKFKGHSISDSYVSITNHLLLTPLIARWIKGFGIKSGRVYW